MLEDYVETKYYRDKHNILSETLTHDIYSSILVICKFDCSLCKIIDYEIKLSSYRVSLVISNLKKRKINRNKDNENDCRPMKRNYLLVPNKSNLTENATNPMKMQKIE